MVLINPRVAKTNSSVIGLGAVCTIGTRIELFRIASSATCDSPSEEDIFEPRDSHSEYQVVIMEKKLGAA